MSYTIQKSQCREYDLIVSLYAVCVFFCCSLRVKLTAFAKAMLRACFVAEKPLEAS